MTITFNDLVTDDFIEPTFEEIAEENLEFRRAFRPYNATSDEIDDDSVKVVVPSDDMEDPEIIPEGAEFPYAEEDFTTQDLDWDKIGKAITISREARRDGVTGDLARQMEIIMRRMDEKLNELAFNQLDGNLHSNSPAGNVGATDALEFDDLVDGRKELRKSGYEPDFIIVNTEAEQDLLTSSEFLRATNFGDETIRSGEIGRILDTPVFSSNAGHMSSSDAEAYMVDTDFYGYEVIRENIATNDFEQPEKQVTGEQIWTSRGYHTIQSDAAIKVQE